jgi:hypothetical protein
VSCGHEATQRRHIQGRRRFVTAAARCMATWRWDGVWCPGRRSSNDAVDTAGRQLPQNLAGVCGIQGRGSVTPVGVPHEIDPPVCLGGCSSLAQSLPNTSYDSHTHRRLPAASPPGTSIVPVSFEPLRLNQIGLDRAEGPRPRTLAPRHRAREPNAASVNRENTITAGRRPAATNHSGASTRNTAKRTCQNDRERSTPHPPPIATDLPAGACHRPAAPVAAKCRLMPPCAAAATSSQGRAGLPAVGCRAAVAARQRDRRVQLTSEGRGRVARPR